MKLRTIYCHCRCFADEDDPADRRDNTRTSLNRDICIFERVRINYSVLYTRMILTRWNIGTNSELRPDNANRK